jgi:hypothetical protein
LAKTPDELDFLGQGLLHEELGQVVWQAQALCQAQLQFWQRGMLHGWEYVRISAVHSCLFIILWQLVGQCLRGDFALHALPLMGYVLCGTF